jgi:ferric-dicitrate binding protein FerR (iron transport regulator)
MAIKGKGKARSRGVAKAPRREPVAVPVPLLRRRWVQIVAAFVVGLLVFWFAIWVTNGLRDQDATRTADEQRQAQTTALQRWQSQVETQIGPIAPLQDPLPPVIAAEAKSAAASLAAGKAPAEDPETLAAQSESLTAAADALEEFDLGKAVANTGLGEGVNTILVSRTQLVNALRLYASAIDLVVAAYGAPPQEAEAMAAAAADIMTAADQLLADSWRTYQLTLGRVGLAAG